MRFSGTEAGQRGTSSDYRASARACCNSRQFARVFQAACRIQVLLRDFLPSLRSSHTLSQISAPACARLVRA
jgi:hypothetical protein